MTNDTTTLNGALAELGETMASNLVTKGVQASASDGLTTLAGKILDIQTGGGSCYHIEFSEASYTAEGGSATVTIYLQANYEPLANATITLSDGSSQYSCITNNSGVASYTFSNLVSNLSITASYSNVSDTCTVNVVTYYFIDDCSSSTHISEYSPTIRISNNNTNTATLSYNSSENAYQIYRSSSYDAFYGFTIPNTLGADNIRIVCKAKLTGASGYTQFHIGICDSTYINTSGNWDSIRIRADGQFIQAMHNNSQEYLTANTGYSVKDNYAYLELVKQGTNLTGKLYDLNMNQLASLSWTGNSYSNPYFFIGENTGSQSSYVYIQSVLAEPI